MTLVKFIDILSFSLEFEVWEDEDRIGIFNRGDLGCTDYFDKTIKEISIANENRLIIYL